MAWTANKPPLYTLPFGIEVTGEYPPRGQNRYWRARVREHRFFSAPIVSGGQNVRRSRVVLSSILGRALLPTEVVHHKDENVNNDSPGNLELTNHAAHNEHHKSGSKHSEITKRKISDGLVRAIKDGRRQAPPRICWIGRKHAPESRLKMSRSRKDGIASGAIKKSSPPILRGENSRSKLRNEDVLIIRRRAAEGACKRALSAEHGVTLQTIYNIINRTTWSHI